MQSHPDGPSYLATTDQLIAPGHGTAPSSSQECVVMDITGSDRLELLKYVAGSASPLLRQPVIVVDWQLTRDAVVQAMRHGAMDVLGYPLEQRRLVCRLGEAMAMAERAEGLRQSVRRYESSLRNLTERERQTLDGLLRGWSNKRIAYHMSVSEKTVTSHRSSLLKKMEAKHLVELVRLVTKVSLVIDTGAYQDSHEARRTGPNGSFTKGY